MSRPYAVRFAQGGQVGRRPSARGCLVVEARAAAPLAGRVGVLVDIGVRLVVVQRGAPEGVCAPRELGQCGAGTGRGQATSRTGVDMSHLLLITPEPRQRTRGPSRTSRDPGNRI